MIQPNHALLNISDYTMSIKHKPLLAVDPSPGVTKLLLEGVFFHKLPLPRQVSLSAKLSPLSGLAMNIVEPVFAYPDA